MFKVNISSDETKTSKLIDRCSDSVDERTIVCDCVSTDNCVLVDGKNRNYSTIVLWREKKVNYLTPNQNKNSFLYFEANLKHKQKTTRLVKENNAASERDGKKEK